jgi:AcrR family transcriptional regulator
MKKNTYHHGDLEEALLKVGMKEARASGARNLGVTYLAKKVRVSPMAVYRHFPSGESLKSSISQRAREELGRRMQEAVDQETDVKRRFMATGRAYINFALQEPGLFSVAFVDCEALPSREDNPSAEKILKDAILDLCNEGYVKTSDVQDIANFAWSVVHGFALLVSEKVESKPSSDKRSIESLLEKAWKGIVSSDD